MASPDAHNGTYLVVGAGVFGSSLALHLIQKYPSADVVLVDRSPSPSQTAASWDWNKVIRADYTNLLYMELALEAKASWRSDALFRPFYHESGLVWLDNKNAPQVIIDNYKKLNATDTCRLATPQEVRELWAGIHADADYNDVTEILINQSSGWAEASRALAKVVETAVAAGVRYVVSNIQEVVFNEQGTATGIRAKDGAILSASHIILATGAMTAKLLADSAPQQKAIHVGKRLVAAAVCEGTIKLSEGESEYYRQGPVFIHLAGDVQGGVIPANAEGQLKIYPEDSFTNTVHHEASGESISTPPDRDDYGQWDPTPGMERELYRVMEGLYGKKSSNWKLETGRICWDAITPTQDPIICSHPHSKGLYIMTGGSFHSWKFLPIIGKYALQMLEGTLDPRLDKTWAWDREDKGSAHERLLPHREMKDV